MAKDIRHDRLKRQTKSNKKDSTLKMDQHLGIKIYSNSKSFNSFNFGLAVS